MGISVGVSTANAGFDRLERISTLAQIDHIMSGLWTEIRRAADLTYRRSLRLTAGMSGSERVDRPQACIHGR